MEPISDEAYADAARAALAILSARIEERWGDVRALLRTASSTADGLAGLATAYMDLLIEQLRAQGHDPAKWAADSLAQVAREEAAGRPPFPEYGHEQEG